MPNHCSNCLIVNGPQEDIDRLIENVQGEKNHVIDFNKIVPIPKELKETTSPSNCPELDKQFIADYGFADWYSWCVANWGTKWSSYDCGDWDHGGAHASWYFSTAWAPPVPVIAVLGPKYPTLTFELTYFEPGCCFAGRLFVHDDEANDEYDESLEYVNAIGEDVFGYEPYDPEEDEE